MCHHESMTNHHLEPGTSPTLTLTVGEAARELRVSRAQVWRWIHDGLLPTRLLSSRVRRILRTDLEAFAANAPDPRTSGTDAA